MRGDHRELQVRSASFILRNIDDTAQSDLHDLSATLMKCFRLVCWSLQWISYLCQQRVSGESRLNPMWINIILWQKKTSTSEDCSLSSFNLHIKSIFNHICLIDQSWSKNTLQSRKSSADPVVVLFIKKKCKKKWCWEDVAKYHNVSGTHTFLSSDLRANQ